MAAFAGEQGRGNAVDRALVVRDEAVFKSSNLQALAFMELDDATLDMFALGLRTLTEGISRRKGSGIGPCIPSITYGGGMTRIQ